MSDSTDSERPITEPSEDEMEGLRYPVGRFRAEPELSPGDRAACIDEIEALPGKLRAAVEDLTDEQLDTPYRPGGWTVRQLVHHVADSHLNSQVRFRWTLTEEVPTIKPYDQTKWAELHDARTLPVDVSLDLLAALHHRWIALLRSFDDDAWARRFVHPEMGKELDLDTNLQIYAWHGRHHLAHVTRLRERKGWST